MLTDIVLDANVLAHSNNPERTDYFASANDLLSILLTTHTKLCLEKGFSLDPATNKSRILHEYRPFLINGTLAYTLIATLAGSDRIAGTDTRVSPQNAKLIKNKVNDNTDRIFIRVALNTVDRVLVSHDDDAFPDAVRSLFKAEISVRVVDCMECNSLLT